MFLYKRRLQTGISAFLRTLMPRQFSLSERFSDVVLVNRILFVYLLLQKFFLIEKRVKYLRQKKYIIQGA